MANKIKIIDASGSRILKKPRINATDIVTNTAGELLTVTAANGVNRVDGLTLNSSVLGFQGVAGGFNDYVYALNSSPNGTLYAGGQFENVDPQNTDLAAYYIAQLSGNTWVPVAGGFNSSVYAITFAGNGTLYAAGNFEYADPDGANTAVNYIAQLSGGTWVSIGGGFNNDVYAMAVSPDGDLYAGGSFTTASGGTITDLNYIARWDGTTWNSVGGGFNSTVNALAFDSMGNLYVGGNFTTASGGTITGLGYVTKWNGENWERAFVTSNVDSTGGVNNSVNVFAIDSMDNIYVGGYFNRIDTNGYDYFARGVAKWNNSMQEWDTLMGGFGNGGVNALSFDSAGNIYAGGDFDYPSQYPAILGNIARWNGQSWFPVDFGLGGDEVSALHLTQSGKLYAGGGFEGNYQYDQELSQGHIRLNYITEIININESQSVKLDSYSNVLVDSKNTFIVGTHNTSYQSHFGINIGGYYNFEESNLSSSIVGGIYNCVVESNQSSVIGGQRNRIYCCSQNSSIVGGCDHSLGYFSPNSTMLGGCRNTIYSACRSTIAGGDWSSINYSQKSSIVAGGGNHIYQSDTAGIFGAHCAHVCFSDYSNALGGCRNCIFDSSEATIIGGHLNCITSTPFTNLAFGSTVIGGDWNRVVDSQKSGVFAGSGNHVTSQSNHSVVIGGHCSHIDGSSSCSAVLGGICSQILSCSSYSSTIGGQRSIISDNSSKSTIIGGDRNVVECTSHNSSIIGGFQNIVSGSSDSVIIGGNNLTLNNQNETVLVPNFIVSGNLSAAGLPTSPGASGTLWVDGDVVKRA
jgi:hypothetical protein